MSDPSTNPTNRSAATVDEQVELTGTLRVDAAPGPRGFQGVHLEVPGRATFLVDYRARGAWRQFDGAEVVVTGGCYEPAGQAIARPHLRIDRLRPTKREPGRRAYLEIGPERWFTGELRVQSGGIGTKMAGEIYETFVGDDGTTYNVVGDDLPEVDRRARIRGRLLEPDMTYTARMNGPDLWVVDVFDEGHAEDPPRPIRCP